MNYQAILFDLDGTLIDTAADFIVTINRLCTNHEITPPSADAIRSTVSDGARALVRLAFALNEGDEDIEALRQELLDIYEQELGKNAPLFAEIQPLLSHIRAQQLPWGIVTNKPRKYTELLLARIQLTVPVVICPCDVSQAKPDPESLLLAAKQLGVLPKQCLYFGDHARDIVAGKAAHMTTAACGWGYITQPEDINPWQADFNCHTAEHACIAAGID